LGFLATGPGLFRTPLAHRQGKLVAN